MKKSCQLFSNKPLVGDRQLFDVESGRSVRQPDTPIIWAGSENSIVEVNRPSPDKSIFLIRGSENPITIHEPGRALVLPKFSNDLTKVFFNFQNHGSVKVWDLGTGEMVHEFIHSEIPDRLRKVVKITANFSPDSDKLITAFHDLEYSMTKVWDIKSGKLLFEIPSVFQSSFSPDGRFILSGWEAPFGRGMPRLQGNSREAIKIWNVNRAFKAYRARMKAKEAKKLGSRIRAKFKSGLKKIIRK